jgi:hypothetical protein
VWNSVGEGRGGDVIIMDVHVHNLQSYRAPGLLTLPRWVRCSAQATPGVEKMERMEMMGLW